jgi:hypothetical protein
MNDYSNEHLESLAVTCYTRKAETDTLIETCKSTLWLKPARILEEEEEKKQRMEKQKEVIDYFEKPDERDFLQRAYDEQEEKRKEIEEALYDEKNNRGILFTGHTTLQTRTFIPLCSLVFRTLYFDDELLHAYEHRILPIGSITESERESMKHWLINCCRIERTMKFLNTFRDLAYEAFAPMGARLNVGRRKAGDFPPATTILEVNLGVDTTMAVMEGAEIDITIIAKDEQHIMYPYLLLSTFELIFQHYVENVSWMKYHFVKKHMCEEKPYLVLNRAFHCAPGIGEARPVMLYIAHMWCIWSRGKLILCKDIIEALLTWIWLVKNEYYGQLSTGQMISVVLNLFKV